jgi:hypothetical protein
MTWTADNVAKTGESRELHFVDYLRRSERARKDSKREQRLAMHECRWCFYVGHGLAGQALTEYTCACCQTEQVHGNTAVPKLCMGCAEGLGACVRCGGTREWKKIRSR